MLFGRRHRRHPRHRDHWRAILGVLGPGLITGASDDDPSGIATYSQAGAQFGYSTCWIMLFTWPLMAAIQEISARIGRVTGKGIAANLREHYSVWLLRPIVTMLLVANFINLGADLGAMGDAVKEPPSPSSQELTVAVAGLGALASGGPGRDNGHHSKPSVAWENVDVIQPTFSRDPGGFSSFSRAAEKMLRTQPALSIAIKRLEEDLGETLFDRSSKSGTLTEAGRILYS